MKQISNTVIHRFSERQVMNALHKIVEDDQMYALFKALEEEGVVLEVLEEQPQRYVS